MGFKKEHFGFKKIELDDNNYIYSVISSEGYPCGVIRYSEEEKGFVFKPKDNTALSLYDLEEIVKFMINHNLF